MNKIIKMAGALSLAFMVSAGAASAASYKVKLKNFDDVQQQRLGKIIDDKVAVCIAANLVWMMRDPKYGDMMEWYIVADKNYEAFLVHPSNPMTFLRCTESTADISLDGSLEPNYGR